MYYYTCVTCLPIIIISGYLDIWTSGYAWATRLIVADSVAEQSARDFFHILLWNDLFYVLFYWCICSLIILFI